MKINKNYDHEPKMTMQFKLALAFFLVMLISSTVSLSILLIFSRPFMKENAVNQLTAFANSAKQMSGEGMKYDEIIALLNTNSYDVIELEEYSSEVEYNIHELQKNGFYIESEGFLPNATMLLTVGGHYFKISNFNSDNLYLLVVMVMIIAFIASIIMGTIITTFVGKSMLLPIHELSKAASEVARGNFSVRVEESSNNEYRVLQRNFNKMAEELSGIETLRGDFISNVSHEFKTPLASIQGFAKLLQDPKISAEDSAEYTQIIIDETSRLSRLSSNILNLTKLENQSTIGKKHRFSIDEQIRKIILMLEPEWSKKDIDLDINLEEILYVGNEELMGQIWQNIINNAIKFTPQGGNIKVKLFRSGTGVVVKISDNGPGIPPDKIDKIFEKFYQGDRSRATEGNGLGLALVRRIVDLSDGDVKAENLFEGGVCFTVELPYQTEGMR